MQLLFVLYTAKIYDENKIILISRSTCCEAKAYFEWFQIRSMANSTTYEFVSERARKNQVKEPCGHCTKMPRWIYLLRKLFCSVHKVGNLVSKNYVRAKMVCVSVLYPLEVLLQNFPIPKGPVKCIQIKTFSIIYTLYSIPQCFTAVL